jgi:hypothetical protein
MGGRVTSGGEEFVAGRLRIYVGSRKGPVVRQAEIAMPAAFGRGKPPSFWLMSANRVAAKQAMIAIIMKLPYSHYILQAMAAPGPDRIWMNEMQMADGLLTAGGSLEKALVGQLRRPAGRVGHFNLKARSCCRFAADAATAIRRCNCSLRLAAARGADRGRRRGGGMGGKVAYRCRLFVSLC